MIGRVKSYDKIKGYGFLKSGRAKIFVHAKDLRDSGIPDHLFQDEQLEFEAIEGERGLRAINVRRV